MNKGIVLVAMVSAMFVGIALLGYMAEQEADRRINACEPDRFVAYYDGKVVCVQLDGGTVVRSIDRVKP